MNPQVSDGYCSVRRRPVSPVAAAGPSLLGWNGGDREECSPETGEIEALLMALAEAVEQRDPHIARHCERLAFTSVALGMALHLDRPSLVALYRGGFLHDIGKVGIPDDILFQPTRLTPEQWVIMQSHTIRGERICRPVKAFAPVLPIIRHHHEKWDGSGYPDGLRGTDIPLLARVLQVADIYDALTSPRPYKPAYSIKEALRILETETELGYRDPDIVSRFFQLHGTVIARIEQLSLSEDTRFEAALGSLDEAVNQRRMVDRRPNGRNSSPPPQSAPEAGFPWAAGGT